LLQLLSRNASAQLAQNLSERLQPRCDLLRLSFLVGNKIMKTRKLLYWFAAIALFGLIGYAIAAANISSPGPPFRSSMLGKLSQLVLTEAQKTQIPCLRARSTSRVSATAETIHSETPRST
jgi:hypothetical protein